MLGLLAGVDRYALFLVAVFLLFSSGCQGDKAILDNQGIFRQIGGPNTALEKMLRRQIYVRTKYECLRHCLLENLCISFNFEVSASAGQYRICEMNIDTADGCGRSLSYREGFKYYEQISGSKNLAPMGTFKAAAFESESGVLSFVYMGMLVRFGNLGSDFEGIQFMSLFSLTMGWDIRGMTVVPVGDGVTTAFTYWLADGTVGTGNRLTANGQQMGTPILGPLTIKGLFGNHVPDVISDVLEIDNKMYVLADNVVYTNESQWSIRQDVPDNPLLNAPKDVDAATRVSEDVIAFFKGTKYYLYDLNNRTTYKASVVI